MPTPEGFLSDKKEGDVVGYIDSDGDGKIDIDIVVHDFTVEDLGTGTVTQGKYTSLEDHKTTTIDRLNDTADLIDGVANGSNIAEIGGKIGSQFAKAGSTAANVAGKVTSVAGAVSKYAGSAPVGIVTSAAQVGAVAQKTGKVAPTTAEAIKLGTSLTVATTVTTVTSRALPTVGFSIALYSAATLGPLAPVGIAFGLAIGLSGPILGTATGIAVSKAFDALGITDAIAGVIDAAIGALESSFEAAAKAAIEAGTAAQGRAGLSGSTGFFPVVIDLDGNGITLASLQESKTQFDVNNDGYKEYIGWTKGGDGILVVDLNGDGKIEGPDELSFASRTTNDPNDTDLEALGVLYDSDGNQIIDRNDANWGQLRVWVDENGNGVTDPGELKTLDEVGIVSISVNSDGQVIEINGNKIHGQSTVTLSNNTTISAGDVEFETTTDETKKYTVDGNTIIEYKDTLKSIIYSGNTDKIIMLTDNQFNIVYSGDGNDQISAATEILDVSIYGKNGNDTITGGQGDDILFGDDGIDILLGGDGDDVIYFDSNDTVIDGGSGFDHAILTERISINIDLNGKSIEIITVVDGNDTIHASDQGSVINSGAGNDLVFGSAGDDVIDLGIGNDWAIAGDGDDYVMAKKDDNVDLGDGTDIVEFTGAGVIRDISAINAEIALGTSMADRFTVSESVSVFLSGGGGDDILTGNNLSDTLAGGINDDFLAGGSGNDQYRFARGGGHDELLDRGRHITTEQYTIENGTTRSSSLALSNYHATTNIYSPREDGGNDTLRFGANIVKTDLVFTFRDQDLYIGLADGSNKPAWALADFVRLVNWLDPRDRIESMEFDNGEVLNIETYIQSLNLYIPHLPTLDTLTGSSGDNFLNGNGDGNFIDAGAGNDTITAGGGRDRVEAGTGNDVISGEGDDDRLFGGAGNDTYKFNRGDAWDEILDEATVQGNLVDLTRFTYPINYTYVTTQGAQDTEVTLTGTANVTFKEAATEKVDAGNDKIQFGTGIGVEDLAIRQINNDWVIGVRDSTNPTQTFWELTDRLRVFNWTDARNRIESLVFADGTIIDTSKLVSAVAGESSADTLSGTKLGDWISGGGGNDVIATGAGNDIAIGNDGDDIIDAGEGSDLVYGGAGADFVSYTNATRGVTVNLGLERGDENNGDVDTLKGIENILGSRGNDSILGDANANSIAGGYGADTIDGGAGIDTVYYDESRSAVKILLGNSLTVNGYGGSAEGDVLRNIEKVVGSDFNDTLVGGSDNDVLKGGLGKDSIVGGAGIDTAGYTGSSAGVEVSLIAGIAKNGDAEGDTLVGIENLTGSTYNDTLTGDAGSNYLTGGSGDDILSGRGGMDTLLGSDGNDWIDYSTWTGSLTADLAMGIAFSGTANQAVLQDIEAIRGSAYADALSGNNANNTFEGGAGADTIDGRVGIDTADYSHATASVKIDLTAASSTWTGDAAGDSLISIENLSGSAFNDTLTGDAGNNILWGAAGNDWLSGGAGNDTLSAGLGNDTLIGGSGIDWVDYSDGTAGVRVDLASGTVDGGSARDSVSGIENIKGSRFNDSLMGDAQANYLMGDTGNDTLDGRVGADTLEGGTGDDVYVVDSTGDVVTETVGGGRDKVVSSIAYTLGANLEDLTLNSATAGVGWGNAVNNYITGSDLQGEILYGLEGDDTIDGGAGADEMHGGVGDDLYIVDRSDDRIVEAANEGTDTVNAKASYTLGAELENLVLIGTATAGTGNTLDNILMGNDSDNWLNGVDGNDTLQGGLGNDTLVGGNGKDMASYTDATAAVNVSLVAGALGVGASAAGDSLSGIEGLIGSTFNDTLVGSTTDDTLIGGKGADSLVGGAGNDTYYVDQTGDVIVETSTGGTSDTVISTISYTLSSYLENLVLSGTEDLSGNGNSGNNKLTGNDGDNTLDGSTGADTMDGGKGNDVYIVDSISDSVIEVADGGLDEIRSSVSITSLAANVENLVLTGTALNGVGNDLNNKITVGAATTLNNSLFGGNGDDTLDGGTGADTLNGGDGYDMALFATATASVLVNLVTGTAVSGGVTDKLIGIEGAIGSDFNDTFLGTNGDDYFDGGKGADSMAGGAGNDVYIVDNIGDIVNEDPGTGIDRIEASVSFYLTDHAEVLILTGTDSIDGSGNAERNYIQGNSAANRLDGGAGIDTLIGGGGNDTYIIDTVDDQITEYQGGGVDRVIAAVNYTLGTELEELQFLGTAAISGTGNELDNKLIGNDGNNSLSGLAGNDTLAGGLGADTLDGGNGFDIVDYSAATAAVSVNLATGIISGTSIAVGDVLRSIEGIIASAYNDTLVGDAGDNRLDGGAGNDSLVGGLGDDVYVVNSIGDIVSENVNAGRDLVEASIDYTLGANLESVILTGTANIKATGNALDNILSGNDGNNILDGAAGADTMAGGKGNDTYYVDNTGDQVLEAQNEGIDLIVASADYTLSANVENLTLAVTSVTIRGTGNNLDNLITGNGYDNTLSGAGGNDTILALAGNDTVDGGEGDDSIDGGTGNDTLFGGTGNDYITDNGGSNFLQGGLGEDTLVGSTNADTLDGGYGNDNISAGLGNDLIHGDGGSDYIWSDAGADTIYGGSSAIGERDIVSYANSTAAVTVYLSGVAGVGGDAAGDQLHEIEKVIGSSYNDWIEGTDGAGEELTGGAGNDTLHGFGGNDEVNGGDGDDSLKGGDGDDLLQGGVGADRLYGGNGIDTARYSYASSGVQVSLTTGTGTVGEAAGDLLFNIENLKGSKFGDYLWGDGNNNVLTGDDGDDSLWGGSGNDTLQGDNGNDILNSGIGDDLVSGGAGGDIIFDYEGSDTIIAGTASDSIHLNYNTTTGTQVRDDTYANIVSFKNVVVNGSVDGTDYVDGFNASKDHIQLTELFNDLGFTATERGINDGYRLVAAANGTYDLQIDTAHNNSFSTTIANIAILAGSGTLDATDFIIS